MSDAVKLFDQIETARGADYVRARDALLTRTDAAKFLDEQKTKAGDSERWMAEILSERLARREEFDRLERVFDAKMPTLVLGRPHWSRNRRPRGSDLHTGLLLPDEQAPKISLRYSESSPGIRQHEQALIKYNESIRLPASECWRPFLSEILLKGWSPTTVPLAAEPKPLAERDPDEDGIPRDRKRTLASDDYLRQAVLLLGKLGEQRAAPRLMELVTDTAQDGRTRLLAARSLGFMRTDEALEALLCLVEDEQTTSRLRLEAFYSLARLKDVRAVPALERIAANPDGTLLPGALGPARWKMEARAALAKIRGH